MKSLEIQIAQLVDKYLPAVEYDLQREMDRITLNNEISYLVTNQPFDAEHAARQIDAQVLHEAMTLVKKYPEKRPVDNPHWKEIENLWNISDYLQRKYLNKN